MAVLAAIGAITSHAQWLEITGNFPGTLGTATESMATDGQRLYVLGQANAWVSSDHGASFTRIDQINGSSSTLPAGLMIEFQAGSIWMGGDPGSAFTSENRVALYRLTPGQLLWNASLTTGPTPLTLGYNVSDIAYDDSTGRYFMASPGLGDPMWTSTDGINWTAAGTGLAGGPGLPFTVVAYDGVALATRVGAHGIYRTTDNGQSWTQAIATGIEARDIVQVGSAAVAYDSGNFSGDERFLSTVDGGATWREYQAAVPGRYNFSSDGTHVFAAAQNGFLGGQLLFSANQGRSFAELDLTGLPTNVAPEQIIRVGDYLYIDSHPFDDAVTLWRRPVSELDLRVLTEIVVEPEGGTFLDGSDVVLTVEAVGENLNYQWFKGTSELTGETGATLTLANASSANDGDYTVEVTGDRGSDTSVIATVEIGGTLAGRIDNSFVNQIGSAHWGDAVVLDNGNVVQVDYFSAAVMDPAGAVIVQANLGSTDIRNFVVDQDGWLVIQRDRALERFDLATLTADSSWPLWESAGTGVLRDIQELPGKGYLVLNDRGTTHNSESIQHLTLVKYDGTIDPEFSFFDTSTSSVYNQLAVTPDGSIYIRRDTAVFRVDDTGSQDAGFSASTNFPNPRPTNIWALSDNRILGTDSRNGGAPFIYNLDGTPDDTFNVDKGRFNDSIYDFVEESNGKLVFVGEFTSWSGGGQTVLAEGYARLNVDGTIDPTFYSAQGFETDLLCSSAFFTAKDTGGVAYDPGLGVFYVVPVATDNAQFQRGACDGTNVRGIARIYGDSVDGGGTGGDDGFDTFASSLPEGFRTPQADPDNDGLSNLLEYLLGLDASAPAAGTPVDVRQRSAADLGLSGDGTYLTLEVRRLRNAGGIVLTPRAGTTLEDLGSLGSGVVQHGNPVAEGDYDIVTYRSVFSLESVSRAFFDIQVYRP